MFRKIDFLVVVVLTLLFAFIVNASEEERNENLINETLSLRNSNSTVNYKLVGANPDQNSLI